MVIETWLKTDRKKPIMVKALQGNLFSADNGANLIGVEVVEDGSPATLSGGVIGYVVRADGATVVVNGTLSDNKATVTLPASCYTVVGPISIVIKVGTTTVGACTGYVYRSSTDEFIDPGHVVPSLQELLAQIQNCIDATASANTAAQTANTAAQTANTAAQNVGSIVAQPYSSSSTYTAGDYCTNNGNLYKANQDISTAEEWTASHWTQIVIGDEVTGLKSVATYTNDSKSDSFGLVKYSEFDQLLHYDKVPGASNSTVLGVTRYGTVCVLDGGGCSSTIKFKMTGSAISRTISSPTVNEWTEPITLEPGRTYIATLHHLSGTQSARPSIGIYKTGKHATYGTEVVATEAEYVSRFVYEGTPIHIAVVVPANSTYENAEYNITLEKEAIDVDLASNTLFSEQYSYSIGDVVAYEGSLYVFTASHLGAWDTAHVALVGEQKTVGFINIPTGGVFNGYPGSGTFHSGAQRTVWTRAFPNCRYFIGRTYKNDRFRVGFGNEKPVNGGSYIAVTTHDDNTSIAVTAPEGASYIFVYCTTNGSSYDADTVASWISFTVETDGDATAMIALDDVKNEIALVKSGVDVILKDINSADKWVQGGIGSNGENYDARSTSIRTNEYLPIDQYASIVTTANFSDGFLALYSESRESGFIVRQTIGTDVTIDTASIKRARPTATHFRIEIKNVDGDTNAYDQVQTIGIYIPEPEQDSRAEDVYTDLISQSRYIYAATDSGVSSEKPLTLLHFTDIHADLSGMKYVLETYDKYSSKIDAILHTGDTVRANFSDGIANWISSGCASVVLNTIGNHDTGENLVLQQAGKDNEYNAFFAPYISGWNVTQPTGVEDSTSPNYHALYYYKDFATPGVRLIVLDTNWWDSTEKTWLSDVLNDALTNSLCVVIACHTVKKLTEMTESNFSSYTGNGINDTGNSYGNQPDDWLDPVQTFISSGGNFACILAGHNHSGHMGHMTNYPDIFVYVADKSSIARVSGTARISDEINQNTVSVVTINPVEKLIKIVKIGAEVDGKMRGRHVFCYDYANKRIVSQW